MSSLTPEEEALLSQQVDPDVAGGTEYQYDTEYQRLILGMLLNDRTFLQQSMGLVQPSYFSNDVHKTISKILFKYFETYKNRPSRIILNQEIENIIHEKPPEVKLRYRGELNTVCDNYIPAIEERDYLRDKIVDFAKEQAVKQALFKTLDIFKNERNNPDRWPQITNLFMDALAVDRNFDVGELYFEGVEERYMRVMASRAKGDLFTTGLHSIDNALSGGGLLRGEIGAWTGISGTGKSLMLTAAAVSNLRKEKRVLYVTLEMDQDRTAERFDAQFADPANLHNVGINNLYENKDIVVQALTDYVKDKEDSRLLVIKHFPSGSMDMSTLRAYFSQLQLYGFQPDLLVLDYVGEIKDDRTVATWESRQRFVRDLRGFASEEHVCVLTALQVDKKAKETVRSGQLIDDDNLADSYGQIRPLDALWSVNQTVTEKLAGVARVRVIKHRSGESQFIVYLDFDKRQLRYSEITQEEYERRKKDASLRQDIEAKGAAADEIVRGNAGKKGKKKDVKAPEDVTEAGQQLHLGEDDNKPVDAPGM